MKSPLKSNPLRNPGESVDHRLTDVLLEEIFMYFMLAAFILLITGLEWWKWYMETPPNPFVMTVLAVIVVTYCIVKVHSGLKKAKRLKLGRDGEKAVGQYLERLRESGAQVLHDFPGEGFNVDHVVIHTSGVYAIETKTYSKPDKGEAIIVFNGESIALSGKKPQTKPVVQSQAAAKWLSNLINESTGRHCQVRPVVVFPGWYIQPTAEAKVSQVWVLNPKALPVFIANSKQQMSPEDAKLITYYLSRYVRTV